jgi:GntR family transcriptional regulator
MVLGNRPEELIDKSIPVPYHYQLREIWRQEIMTGRWPVNEKLPSERELGEWYEVSRPTIREAMDALVSEGLLRREKGRGTFVAEPKIVEGLLQTPYGFTDSMEDQGILFATSVLGLDIVPAPPTMARELRLPADAPVIRLERIRSVIDTPILMVTSYLPEEMFPGLLDVDFTRRSLYETLRADYGITMARARRFMEAVAANRQDAEILGVEPGDPLMLIESTTYTQDGVPFEFYRAQHRGDRTRFLVESFHAVVWDDEID